MNERIRELAEQAGLEFDDDLVLEPEAIYYTTQKDLEKFAELIVRECADLFDKDEIELSYTMRTIHNTIKEHFGVE
jgi:hypothetical protein